MEKETKKTDEDYLAEYPNWDSSKNRVMNTWVKEVEFARERGFTLLKPDEAVPDGYQSEDLVEDYIFVVRGSNDEDEIRMDLSRQGSGRPSSDFGYPLFRLTCRGKIKELRNRERQSINQLATSISYFQEGQGGYSDMVTDDDVDESSRFDMASIEVLYEWARWSTSTGLSLTYSVFVDNFLLGQGHRSGFPTKSLFNSLKSLIKALPDLDENI